MEGEIFSGLPSFPLFGDYLYTYSPAMSITVVHPRIATALAASK